MARGIAQLVLLAAVATLATLGGCAADEGDGGILVLKNVHADTNCTASSLATEASVPHGSLDLLLPSDYYFIAQMKSRITALTGQEDQRTIITKDAKVDIDFPDSTLFSAGEIQTMHDTGLTHFKSLFTAPILPNGGIQDGGFVLIPRQLVLSVLKKFTDPKSVFRLEAVATFTIEGDMSGATVVSQPFTYAVTLGNQTSVNIVGNCPLATGTQVLTGYGCNAAQDGIVDCCLNGDNLVCPATVAK